MSEDEADDGCCEIEVDSVRPRLRDLANALFKEERFAEYHLALQACSEIEQREQQLREWAALGNDMLAELRQDYGPGELVDADGPLAIRRLRALRGELAKERETHGATLENLADAESALAYLDKSVRNGTGAVTLSLTEDGNIGVWINGRANLDYNASADGTGDTVDEAIADAISRTEAAQR